MKGDYAERVRRCMQEHGMDADALGTEARLPRSVVQDVLAGRIRRPQPFVRERLATALRAPALLSLDPGRGQSAASKSDQAVYESAGNFNRFADSYGVAWDLQQELWGYGMKATDTGFQLRALALKVGDWVGLYRRRYRRDPAASGTLFDTELWRCTGCGFETPRALPRCPECGLSEDDTTPFERVR